MCIQDETRPTDQPNDQPTEQQFLKRSVGLAFGGEEEETSEKQMSEEEKSEEEPGQGTGTSESEARMKTRRTTRDGLGFRVQGARATAR